MPTLSVAMIAYNEAENIPRSLQSVRWADQIVVVDCDSADDTVSTAIRLGAEVYTTENNPNLNIAKNLAIDKCQSEWILILDADEIIPDDLAGEIRLILSSPCCDGYLIPRRNYTLGRWLRRGGEYPDCQLRLFRRGRGRFPARHIHERLHVDGAIGKLHHPFNHYPYPDISSFLRKNLRDAEFEAVYRYKQGHRIGTCGLMGQLGLRIPGRYICRYLFRGGILDGVPGLIRAWFDAMNEGLRWIRLWEIRRRQDNKPGDRV
ncbi:MAG: glycosyltransferase family 2 protein [Calditrichota bacterium]